MADQEFIDIMPGTINKRLAVVDSWIQGKKEEFAKDFKKYIAKILDLMCQLLPINDPIIDILDFVKLDETESRLKEKVVKFNDELHIVSKSDIPQLKEEIGTNFENSKYRIQ